MRLLLKKYPAMKFNFNRLCERLIKSAPVVRALLIRLIRGVKLRRLGIHCKILGAENISFGSNISIGDFCWIEAVTKYSGVNFKPIIIIGNNVSISDLTHISAIGLIRIGNGCLLGSKIYIGDHTHGLTEPGMNLNELPALRSLSNYEEIVIGDNCWIGDGAVILPGTRIHAGSIIAANSVCKLNTVQSAVIAGAPAKIIRYL